MFFLSPYLPCLVKLSKCQLKLWHDPPPSPPLTRVWLFEPKLFTPNLTSSPPDLKNLIPLSIVFKYIKFIKFLDYIFFLLFYTKILTCVKKIIIIKTAALFLKDGKRGKKSEKKKKISLPTLPEDFFHVTWNTGIFFFGLIETAYLNDKILCFFIKY